MTPWQMGDQWFKDAKDVGGQVQSYCDHLIDQDPSAWWQAGAIKTAYDGFVTLSAPVIDLFRLGEGSAKGGWGFGEDALRLIQIVGPEGRYLAIGLKSRLIKLGSMVPNGTLQNCVWIAGAKALRMTGVRAFATVNDLARVAGIKPMETAESTIAEIVPLLRKLGAQVQELKDFTVAPVRDLNTLFAVNRQNEVLALAESNLHGVILFGVSWIYKGEEVGHALLAYRDPLKGLVIADRSGRVFRSFEELGTVYQGIAGALPNGKVVFIKDAVLVNVVRKLGLLSTLAYPVRVLQLRGEELPQNGRPPGGVATRSAGARQ